MVDAQVVPFRHRIRARFVLAAIAIIVALVVATVAIVDRSSKSGTIAPATSHRIQTPTEPESVSVVPPPSVDVVSMFLWVTASDAYANGAVRERIAAPGAACDLGPVKGGAGHYYLFEDPDSYRGSPSPPTYPAPSPPTRSPSCTPEAADAARRVRELSGSAFGFVAEEIPRLEKDPPIAAAVAAEIDCLHARGIDRVSDDGYISDGWVMAHPDEHARAMLAFADCVEPVVAVRTPIRTAARDAYVTEHRDTIDALQAAFDDYLTAVYSPKSGTTTVTTSIATATIPSVVAPTTATNAPGASDPMLRLESCEAAPGLETWLRAVTRPYYVIPDENLIRRPLAEIVADVPILFDPPENGCVWSGRLGTIALWELRDREGNVVARAAAVARPNDWNSAEFAKEHPYSYHQSWIGAGPAFLQEHPQSYDPNLAVNGVGFTGYVLGDDMVGTLNVGRGSRWLLLFAQFPGAGVVDRDGYWDGEALLARLSLRAP